MIGEQHVASGAESRNGTVAAPPPLDVNASGAPVEQIIKPSGRWPGIGWAELWRYRELLYFLTWRDVKIRYKQTVLGAAWAVLQPLATMIAFTLIFGRFAGLDQKTGGVPYPVYVYAGLLPWTLFANSVTGGSQSVLNNANLITKVYFPRLIVPIAAVGTVLVDFFISFGVLVILMKYYGVPLSWTLLLLPVHVLGTVVAAVGVGTLLAALSVAYRDVKYTVPFMMQLWMFITPVIYPLSIVPAEWWMALHLNPMTGLLEGFRAAVLGQPLNWAGTLVSWIVAAAILVCATFYFRAVERRFPDIV